MEINFGKYDYKIVVDRSGSMAASDCQGGISRWEQAHKWSKEIADFCGRHDDDGIDIILFDSNVKEFNNVTADKVDAIFSKYGPNGTTDTALAIRTALPEFFTSTKKGFFGGSKLDTDLVKRAKPVVIVVFTDGQPNSEEDVKSAIIHITKRIQTREEVGFTFLQVGSDRGATRFLKELDDNLKGAKMDIVDTVDYESAKFMTAEQIITGALTD